MRPFALDELAAVAVNRWRPNSEQHEQTSAVGRIADVIGVNPNTVHDWRRNGLGFIAADRAAVRLGMHPGEIWPQWWDVA